MKILFDTNIVLDLFLERKPFVESAQFLFEQVESRKIEGYIGATTVTTLDYLLTKALSPKEAKTILKKLLKLFEVAPISRFILEDALDSHFSDFEDAVLHAAALHSGLQAIVTRDEKGFANAKLAIHTPDALMKIFQNPSVSVGE